MLQKPVVTLRNTHPGEYLLDVQTTDAIGAAIEKALTHPDALMQAIDAYTAEHEAHRDGHNCARVLEAIDDFAAHYQGHLPHKPWNIWRKLQMVRNFIRSTRW